MTVSHDALHAVYLGILRAQAHSTNCVLNCSLLLAQPNLRPAAHLPCPGQVRIEVQSSSDQRGTLVHITNHVAESQASRAQRERVILAELRGASRQPTGFGNLVHRIPTTPLALTVAARRRAVGRGEFRVELY